MGEGSEMDCVGGGWMRGAEVVRQKSMADEDFTVVRVLRT